jgi:hypothetical protein
LRAGFLVFLHPELAQSRVDIMKSVDQIEIRLCTHCAVVRWAVVFGILQSRYYKARCLILQDSERSLTQISALVSASVVHAFLRGRSTAIKFALPFPSSSHISSLADHLIDYAWVSWTSPTSKCLYFPQVSTRIYRRGTLALGVGLMLAFY